MILTRKDTEAIKGIALILLLVHHLFYTNNGLYDDVTFRGCGLVHLVGCACKVCVALFVFLSGYGLAESSKNKRQESVKRFYGRRFVKLFFNYWFIWLIFVPVGLIFFGYSLPEIYGNHWIAKLFLDLTGLINCAGLYGFNPTWWFYSCIIQLYLFYPVLNYICDKGTVAMTAILLLSFAFSFVNIPPFTPIRFYLFPFVAGICLSFNYFTQITPPEITQFNLSSIK